MSEENTIQIQIQIQIQMIHKMKKMIVNLQMRVFEILFDLLKYKIVVQSQNKNKSNYFY